MSTNTLTPTTTGLLVNQLHQTPGNYVIRSPCGTFKFPAQLDLTQKDLDARCNFTMYPQYKSFYVRKTHVEDSFRLISYYTKRFKMFPNVNVDDMFEGSFLEGWKLKNYEMAKCLCDAYDYNQTEKEKTEAANAKAQEKKKNDTIAKTPPAPPAPPTSTPKNADVELLNSLLGLVTGGSAFKGQSSTRSPTPLFDVPQETRARKEVDPTQQIMGDLMKILMTSFPKGNSPKTVPKTDSDSDSDESIEITKTI